MTTSLSNTLMATTLGGSIAFGGALLISGSGCTVLTNDGLPDDAGVFEGGEAGGEACNACAANACVATWALCFTNSECVAIRACASGASADPTTCACSAADTADAGVLIASSAYRAFATCNDARTCSTCATDCNTSCKDHIKPTVPAACGDDADASTPSSDAGADADADADGGDADVDSGVVDAGDAGPAATTSADTCASCTDGKCGDSKKACAIGSECASFLECAFACATSACVDQCGVTHATGKAAAAELAACTQASCVKDCDLKFVNEN